MLIFIVISLLGIVGYAGFLSSLWAMMKQNGLFDIISKGKWSKWCDKKYNDDSMLEKILGGCERCGSFWLFWLYAPLYAGVTWAFELPNIHPAGWFCWIMVYWFVCSLAGFWAITPKKLDK